MEWLQAWGAPLIIGSVFTFFGITVVGVGVHVMLPIFDSRIGRPDPVRVTVGIVTFLVGIWATALMGIRGICIAIELMNC